MSTLDLARILGVSRWTVWSTVRNNPAVFGRVRRSPSGRFRIGPTHAHALARILNRDPQLLDDAMTW